MLFAVTVSKIFKIFNVKHVLDKSKRTLSMKEQKKYVMSHRNSRPEVFREKNVLENFTKFIGKHLYQSFCYNNVVGPGLQLYQKRDSGTGVFEFYEICKNIFLTLHPRTTASGVISNNRFPFNNLVSIIVCTSKIFCISFLLAIISSGKDEVFFMVGKCINHIN